VPLAVLKVLLEVGANKSVLAAEVSVERGLRDPRLLEQAVDADHVHAFFVEQVVGDGQEAVSRSVLLARRPPSAAAVA
jgi:hypothetical protein